MKKIVSPLLLLAISAMVNAQFTNTKWKATLKPDDPVTVLFSFGVDTLTLTKADDGSFIESMVYKAADSALSLKKITGQSECDTGVTGRYKFVKRDNDIYLVAIADDCAHRLAVLDKIELKKQ